MKITKALINFVNTGTNDYALMYRRIFKYKILRDFDKTGIFILGISNSHRINKSKVKQFEKEVKEFGLEVAIHNVLWLKANQDLKDLKHG